MTRTVAAPGRLGALALLCALVLPIAAQAQDEHAPLPAQEDAAQEPPAPSVAEPALGRIQIFDDWAVACDNRLSCSAVSLVPEGAGSAYTVLVSIQRAGGPAGQGTLRLIGADRLRGKIDILADNHRLARVTARRDMIELGGDQAIGLVRALGSSYAFELRQKKTLIGAPSLRGLSQVLRYMDEQQGRVGSQGALAALGDGPADLARPVPVDPVLAAINTPPVLDTAPLVLSDGEQVAARQLAACAGQPEKADPLEVHALDAEHALVLLPCTAGAYNVSAVPLVARGGAGHWQFSIARFDHVPGFTGAPGTPPLIVNARWNPARGELSSFAKGRGLGDCGTAETYRWDGAGFRLTEARSMPVCRGAWEWPVLYSLAAHG